MRGVTDEQWIPAPPDEESLADPERVAAEQAAARDRPAVERRAEVAWWWPHRVVGHPVADGDLFVIGSARALVSVDGRDGLEVDRRPFERSLVAAPVLAGGFAFVWTDDGAVSGVDRDGLQVRWVADIGPPAPGAMAAASAGRRGPVVLVARADARIAAVQAESGQVLWATKLAAPATHAPAVDDDVAVVVSGGRTVEAIDPRTGKHRWRIHLRNPVHLPPQILGYSVWLAGGGPPGALVRLDAATGAVEGTYGAGDALGGLTTDGRSLFATAAGPARMLVLDEQGRVELAVETTRVCAEPTATPSYAYLADPAGRVLAVDRVRQRVAAISSVLFEPVGAPLLAGRNVAVVARDGHLWAITRPEEQLAPGDT
jgi:outer membrane protein assembly factor BamB